MIIIVLNPQVFPYILTVVVFPCRLAHTLQINVQLELPIKLNFPIKCTLQVHDAKHIILEKGRCSCSSHLLTGFCFMLKI